MTQLKKYYLQGDRSKVAYERILAEEYIAWIAESGEQPVLLQRVIAAIRKQLRKLGLAKEWTDNDIKSLLMETRSALRKQGKALEDVVLTETVKVAETGEEFDIETNAAVAIRQHDKRTEVVRKLRNCL